MTTPPLPTDRGSPRRPDAMRIEFARCIHCELCFDIAPVIRDAPERIGVSAATLDAMAACPTGAIVWCEEPRIEPR
jgi:ferredoxin